MSNFNTKYIGENRIKYTQKIVEPIKYWGFYGKGLINKWFYDDNPIIFGYITF